jgi:hypothetical protein
MLPEYSVDVLHVDDEGQRQQFLHIKQKLINRNSGEARISHVHCFRLVFNPSWANWFILKEKSVRFVSSLVETGEGGHH